MRGDTAVDYRVPIGVVEQFQAALTAPAPRAGEVRVRESPQDRPLLYVAMLLDTEWSMGSLGAFASLSEAQRAVQNDSDLVHDHLGEPRISLEWQQLGDPVIWRGYGHAGDCYEVHCLVSPQLAPTPQPAEAAGLREGVEMLRDQLHEERRAAQRDDETRTDHTAYEEGRLAALNTVWMLFEATVLPSLLVHPAAQQQQAAEAGEL